MHNCFFLVNILILIFFSFNFKLLLLNKNFLIIKTYNQEIFCYYYFLDLINKYTLLIKKITPEKNNTNNHCPKFNATVLKILLNKGIYNIQHIIDIETNTAPNKYILLNIFISNIECLSDLH